MDHITYSKIGLIVEVTIRDHTYRKLDNFKFHIRDSKSSSKFYKIMREKYGFEPEIKPEEAAGADSLMKDQKDLFDLW